MTRLAKPLSFPVRLLGLRLSPRMRRLMAQLSPRSLEASERRAGALLDAIPDNVFRIGRDGRFVEAHVRRNPGIFGGGDAFVGRTLAEILPPGVARLLEAARDSVLETGVAARVEYALEHEGISVQIETRVVRSGRDEIVAISRDVTDLKRQEQELRARADEQAALRRVATVAAAVGGRERERIVHAVTAEVARLLEAQTATTIQFCGDGSARVVGAWGAESDTTMERGTVVPLDSDTATVRVQRTGRPARIDGYDGVPGSLAERVRGLGWRSAVAAPIFVSGRLWGVISAARTSEEPFPAGAEERIGEFGEIVGIAFANAEAREQLAELADEQAALGRVAVAAATERPERLFDIVSEEVGRRFGARWASTVRYTEDGAHVVATGRWGERHPVPVGARRRLTGGVLTRVRETGRPARVDFLEETGEVREEMRRDDTWSSVAAPIVVSGRLWGATVISVGEPDVFPGDVEERLGKFTSLVAVALANAEAREELTASRARIVQAGDAERRRLERNLHDGAQQRLVSLALALRLAQARLEDDPRAAARLLEQAGAELARGLEELRELARGIHPAVLTDRGLAPALRALAERSSIPVRLEGLPGERLPEQIEAAAFYVVAESLTNVAKYASATIASVGLARDDGVLVVEVSDDGIGGADAAKGSGIRGLADRVEALGGRLSVTSERGGGTTVRAELPVG